MYSESAQIAGRAIMKCGGFRVRPVANGAHSEVTFVYWADLGEGLPAVILKQVALMQSRAVTRIRDQLGE